MNLHFRFAAIGSVVVCMSPCAVAQPRPAAWMMEVVGEPVSPVNPSVQVHISAAFSPRDWAYAVGIWDVSADEGLWTDLRILQTGSSWAPSTPGVASGASVFNIAIGQSHIPLTAVADPTNPIMLWGATWTTDDFRPRAVAVNTFTSRFEVYPSVHGFGSESRLDVLTEGSTFIQVIPAPSGACLVVGAGMLCARRRR